MRKKLLFLLFFFYIIFFTGFTKNNESSLEKYYYPDNTWQISTPEQQGMDSEILLHMYQTYGSKGRIIIIKNGYMISNYDQTYLSKDIHHLHSCTKSVISTLIGIAKDEGYLKSVDQKVINFFQDYEINNLDSRKEKIEIFNLLTMTSGMQWSDAFSPTDSDQMNNTSDWAQYVLDKPMVDEPGYSWVYSSGSSQLLSVILQETTGLSALDYATIKIFKPLGITNITWWNDSQGYSIAGWGLHLSTFDITKIGYLFLRNGKWNDKQIVSNEWIRESTKERYAVDYGLGYGFGYGYLWWIYSDLPYYAFKAWGVADNHNVMITVIPGLDMVVVLAGENDNDRELLKNYIIPSIKSNSPLSSNIQAVRELNYALGNNY